MSEQGGEKKPITVGEMTDDGESVSLEILGDDPSDLVEIVYEIDGLGEMIDEVSPGTIWNMNYEGVLESGETIPYTIRRKSDGTIIHSGIITIK